MQAYLHLLDVVLDEKMNLDLKPIHYKEREFLSSETFLSKDMTERGHTKDGMILVNFTPNDHPSTPLHNFYAHPGRYEVKVTHQKFEGGEWDGV